MIAIRVHVVLQLGQPVQHPRRRVYAVGWVLSIVAAEGYFLVPVLPLGAHRQRVQLAALRHLQEALQHCN